MAFDDYNINTSIATAVADSFNETTTTNTLDVEVGVADSFNEDNSVNDSGNTVVGINDSFQEDSHNTDIDMEDSGNQDSYNDEFHFTDNSTNDNSINAGVREYNLGFAGDLHLGGAGGHGHGHGSSEYHVTNHNTVVDQSVNGNIAADGPVFQFVGNESVLASGADSIAVGDDFTSTTDVDQSTTITADGDVLIDSSKTVDVVEDSYNEFTFSYAEDNSVEVDVTDSFNEYELDIEVDDSFNDESLAFDYTEVDVDVDAIVGSNGAAIVDDIAL